MPSESKTQRASSGGASLAPGMIEVPVSMPAECHKSHMKFITKEKKSLKSIAKTIVEKVWGRNAPHPGDLVFRYKRGDGKRSGDG
jgi:hypothetical protein